MANTFESENYFERFQQNIEYPSHLLTPHQVCSQTSENIRLFFSNSLPSREPLQEFFKGVTVDFIRSSKRGFLHNFEMLNKHGKLSVNDVRNFTSMQESLGEYDEDVDHESFSFSLVVMSGLPDIIQFRGFKGLAKNGLVRPPSTAREFLVRLDEMEGEVVKLGNGRINKRTKTARNTALLKTDLFFQGGESLPDYYNHQPDLVETKIADIWNKWLDDIDMSKLREEI